MTIAENVKITGKTPLACGWVIQFRGVREISQLATTICVSPCDEHFAVPEQRRRETVSWHVQASGKAPRAG